MTDLISNPRRLRLAVATAVAGFALLVPGAAVASGNDKLDNALRERARSPRGRSRVIIQTNDPACVERVLRSAGARRGRKLRILNAEVAEVPDTKLNQIAACASSIHADRPAFAMNERTAGTVGARPVWNQLGFKGRGVGIVVIDSGVNGWHDDLGVDPALNNADQPTTEDASYSQLIALIDTNSGPGNDTNLPAPSQVPRYRVTHFVDFVNGLSYPYDDNGHGTHVAGIIAGNGYDSDNRRSGIAPEASIIALKVLDAQGLGNISDVIAAIDYAVAHKDAFNIRVINLSVGAGVFDTYYSDPLTQAAKRAVDAGIVVVAAAGNLGRNGEGQFQYGGITSPGNAPWVLTVGAHSHGGTARRSNDTMAGFSSHGPTYLDWGAKPDLVAPGVGIESLSDATSYFYTQYAPYLLPGTVQTASLPYLSLSGTSMASPVVSGTVALMLEANPALTPNAVKAILQYTAEVKPESQYDLLTQGAGFLNAGGAVRLAAYFAYPDSTIGFPLYDVYHGETIPWSRHIIWGNWRLSGGIITPDANAWDQTLPWGAEASLGGDNIVWGSTFGDNIVWGSAGQDNIVWGSGLGDNIVWGSADRDNIVWGSGGQDNIVWGSDCGGSNCDNIVWGSTGPDNIVWGSADPGDQIAWETDGDSHYGWGPNGDKDEVLWGSYGVENVVWPPSDSEN